MNPYPVVYSVTQLTAKIQGLLEASFDFVWVEGEISNFRAPHSGHFYMVIKDAAAQLRAVMFRPQARYLRFRPEDGMKIIAQGRLGVYAPRGEYQIVVDYLEPLGVGALALAFEQLKRKLAALGLFDADRKRPLPALPRRVAVITSPTGAAIRDFLKVVRRRFANIEVVVVPVRVQGDEACGDMVRALELVNHRAAADVIVLTRGGGSLEDLWAFNREEIAYAIRDSRIPVVSAVGHEVDWTIADLVADLRAPTPSAAAELLVQEKELLARRLRELNERLGVGLRRQLATCRRSLEQYTLRLKDPRRNIQLAWQRLDELGALLTRLLRMHLAAQQGRLARLQDILAVRAPGHDIAAGRTRLDYLRGALVQGMRQQLQTSEAQVRLWGGRMNDLSPLAVLRRGYSIARLLPGLAVLRDARQAAQGQRLEVTLQEGALICRVEDRRDREIRPASES